MRSIRINDRLEIEVHPLATRGDFDGLRAQGFAVSTMGIGGVQSHQWDDFIDALVLRHCGDAADAVIKAMAALPMKLYREVCNELIAETWGSGDEEKNL